MTSKQVYVPISNDEIPISRRRIRLKENAPKYIKDAFEESGLYLNESFRACDIDYTGSNKEFGHDEYCAEGKPKVQISTVTGLIWLPIDSFEVEI